MQVQDKDKRFLVPSSSRKTANSQGNAYVITAAVKIKVKTALVQGCRYITTGCTDKKLTIEHSCQLLMQPSHCQCNAEVTTVVIKVTTILIFKVAVA